MRVFVTGASGHIGSAVVPELIAAGHAVVGLARSDAAAKTVASLGATVRRGDIDDLDVLGSAAAESDGVIHLAFKHDDMRTGNMASAVASDLAAVRALGDALKDSGKPFVGVSGTLSLADLGRAGLEQDVVTMPGTRTDVEQALINFADQGVRASVVRISPITHSVLDRHGFAPMLIALAKRTGVAGYVGDGANRWPAVHTLDLARLYRLALEKAPAGTRWHGVGDEGIPMRDIAQRIGDHLGVPAESIPADRVPDHFGFFAPLIGLDNPMSTVATRGGLGWEPTHPGLIADFDSGFYFTTSP